MIKEIYFEDEAREKLFNGIEKLTKAVGSTLGPAGRTVIISDIYGSPYITKDGVSVAKAIEFKDPVENLGAKLVKEVAEKTAEEAGDGTTTSIVLANALLNNLKGFDPVKVTKQLDIIIPRVLEELTKGSKALVKDDIKHVATISANNDSKIGDIIQLAYNFSNTVKVEEGNYNEDIIKYIGGMKLDVSYFSKHFITNPKKAECQLDNPRVIIIDGKLESLKNLEGPIQLLAAEDIPLLIIADNVSDSVLRLTEANVLSKNLKACIIKSPGFGPHRKDMLRDIADFTGGSVIKDLSKPVTMKSVGILKSCSVLKSGSILVKDESIDISDIVSSLKELLDSKEISKEDKDLLRPRYENLNGKVAIIRVGGGSEVEMKERKDRYDDAVLASACALEEGVVIGGGWALLDAAIKLAKINGVDLKNDNSIESFIYNSMMKPQWQIITNKNAVISIKPEWKDNIIDPLKVTRCALQNAVSVVKTILSTNTVVLSDRQWN